MSKQLLNFIAGNKPLFNAEYAILSAPVRHLFMIGIIWYLNRPRKRSYPDMHILEIGSWMGASALSFAQGLIEYNNAEGKITCLDAWQPFLNREIHNNMLYQTMENVLQSEIAYDLFKHNIATIPETITCQHLRGMSSNLLPLLKNELFDIVFIDADHAYTPVKADILQSLNLVKNGGIICGDDLNLQYSQVDPLFTKEQAEQDLVQESKTKRNYHPGVTLAVYEIFGEVSCWGGFWAMQKRDNGWMPISLKGMPIVYPAHFPDEANQKAAEHFKDLAFS